ncbi:TPA: hypothetical protein ACQZCI_004710 [Escherichia coli]
MAYSEEQRPEAQLGNQNRNSLNIQQPGETDSYEAFFSDSNRWKDNSTSFSLGDVRVRRRHTMSLVRWQST